MANLKKNLAYNFILSCSQVLLPVISIPYVSRILDPEGIGSVGFIDSLTYYFIAVAEFGIVVYGIREVARVKDNKEQLRKLVSELLVLHILSSCFSFVIYSITVWVLWQKIGDIRLVLFSVSFLLVNFFACEWYFWGVERFRYITFRSLTTRLLGLASLFILVTEPGDYYIYYGIIVLAAMGNTAWNAIILFREVPVTGKNIHWRRHIKYTWVTYLVSLFYSVIIMLDSVLLRIVSTAAAVGIYTFSIKIVRLGSIVLTDIFLVLYPRTVSLLKEEKTAELKQTVLKSIQLIILLSVPACVGLFLMANQFVDVFLGNSFLPVSDNLKILAVFPFIKSYSLFLSKQVLISYDKEKLYLKSLISGSIFFVVTALVLSYYLQDKGTCYAIILTELFILVMNYYYVKKSVILLKLFDRTVFAQAIVGSLVFIPVVWLINNYVASPLINLVLAIITCIAVYFIIQVFVFKNRLLFFIYQKVKEIVAVSGNTR